MALFKNEITEIRNNCRVSLQPQQDYMVQLNSSTFLLFQSETRQAEMTCEVGTLRQSWRFRGVRLLTVMPNCQIITPSFIFESCASTIDETISVEQRPIEVTSLFDPADLSKILALDMEQYHRLSLIGSSAGVHIAELSQGFREAEAASVFNISLFSILCALGMVVGCLCLMRTNSWKQNSAYCCRAVGFGTARQEPAMQMNQLNQHEHIPLNVPHAVGMQ